MFCASVTGTENRGEAAPSSVVGGAGASPAGKLYGPAEEFTRRARAAVAIVSRKRAPVYVGTASTAARGLARVMLLKAYVAKIIPMLIRIAVTVLAVGAFFGACGQLPGRESHDGDGRLGWVWLPESVPQPPPPSPPLPLARWLAGR
jgi:hypothetical protein